MQKKYGSTRFALDTQESQWSTNLNQNSFHPIDPDSKSKSLKDLFNDVNVEEPEIVTAGPTVSNEDDSVQEVCFLFLF